MQEENLHEVLRSLYDEMMPLAADMAAVAKGLAGLGALFYVAIKVWQTISRAEPIDLYPLLRPFALGICIMFFPTLVLGTLNSVLRPVVTGTHAILESQVIDMKKLQEQKDILEYEAIVRNPETAFLISDEEFDAIKHHCINPVDSRETGLQKPETLVTVFPEPEDVKIFDGFKEMPEAELK